MPVQSVIQIPVEDSEFQRYLALWKKYQDELKKQPELWARLSKHHKELTTQWGRVATSFANQADELDRANDALGDQDKHLTQAASLWGTMEKSSRNVASNVLGATTSLLKWTGLLSGLSGILGYFSLEGLMHLGSTASGWRQTAMGLGVSTGQERAFGIAFSRLLGNPSGVLSGVAGAATDYSKMAPLYALGLNPSAPTADLAIDTLKAVRALVVGQPNAMLGTIERSRQLDQLGFSVEDLRRIRDMKGGEFNHLLGTFGTDTRALNLSDRTTQLWQDFMMNMAGNKGRIENVFVRSLGNLTGPVSNVTKSLAHLLEIVMRKGGVGSQAIDTLAHWLDNLAKTLQDKSFLDGLKQFTSEVGTLKHVLHDIHHPGDAGMDLLRLEAKGNTAAAKQAGSWIASLGRGIGGWFGGLENDFMNWRFANTVGYLDSQTKDHAKDAQLLSHYHGNAAKALAAYQLGEGNLDALLDRLGKRGAGDAWQKYLPAQTQSFLQKASLAGPGITITIVNKTGADVNASVASLGATP